MASFIKSAITLAMVLAVASASSPSMEAVINRAIEHAGLRISDDAQLKAVQMLQRGGIETEAALESMFPFIQWKDHFPSFPVAVQLALAKHYSKSHTLEAAVAGEPKTSHSETASGEDIVLKKQDLVHLVQSAVRESEQRMEQRFQDLLSVKAADSTAIQPRRASQASSGEVADKISETTKASTQSQAVASRRTSSDADSGELAEAISDASLWLQKDDAKIVLGSAADVSVFRSGAGEMCAATDFRIEGKLGVGSTGSPGAKLEIVEGTAGVTKLKIDDTNNNSNDYHILTESNFGSANKVQFWTKSNGDAFVAGRLGVGTQSPATQLELHGDAQRSIRFDTEDKAFILLKNNGLPLGPTKTLGIGFTPINSGASPPAVSAVTGGWDDDIESGLLSFRTSDDNGATLPIRMSVMSSGNVGIGTADPQQQLHVAGDARVAKLLLGTSCATCNNPVKALHVKGSGAQALRIEDSASSNLAYDVEVDFNTGFKVIEVPKGGGNPRTTRLAIAKDTGRVGVGAATVPKAALHVSGGVAYGNEGNGNAAVYEYAFSGEYTNMDVLDLTLQHTQNPIYGWGTFYIEIDASISHCGGGCPHSSYHRKAWMNGYCGLYDTFGGAEESVEEGGYPLAGWAVSRVINGHNGHGFDCTLLRITHKGMNAYAADNLISADAMDAGKQTGYTHLSVTRLADDGEGDVAIELKVDKAGCCHDTGSINAAARSRFGTYQTDQMPTEGRGFVSVDIKGTAKSEWLKPSVYTGGGWFTLLPQDGGSEFLTNTYRTFANYVKFGTGSGGPNPGFSITQATEQNKLMVGSAALFKNPFVADAADRGKNLPGQWFVRLRSNVPFTLLKQTTVDNDILTTGRCDIDCNAVCSVAACDAAQDEKTPYHSGQACRVSGCPGYVERGGRAVPWATSAWYLTNEVYGTDKGLGFMGVGHTLQECMDKCTANEHCTAIFGAIGWSGDGSCWTSTDCTESSCKGLKVHQHRYRVHFRPT